MRNSRLEQEQEQAETGREDSVRTVPEASRARMYSWVPPRRVAAKGNARTDGTVHRLAALRPEPQRLLAGRGQERCGAA